MNAKEKIKKNIRGYDAPSGRLIRHKEFKNTVDL